MRQRFERYAVLAVLIASPFWLPSIPSTIGSSLRTTVTEHFKPLLQGVQELRLNSWAIVGGFLQGPALLWENKLLKDRLAAAVAHEETHRILAQENERLRALLGFKAQAPWQTIPAQAIGRDFNLWSRGLLLDKGSRHGVRAGQAVATPVGLAGRITEVGPTTSRMILVTDPHFRVSAALSKSRNSGLAMGTSSGDCLLSYIPLDVEISPGELVVTSGGSSFSPGGIPIGKVAGITQDSSKLFRVARLSPASPLSALDEVLIIAWSPSDSP
jgi:rod shape-determining protein MreC